MNNTQYIQEQCNLRAIQDSFSSVEFVCFCFNLKLFYFKRSLKTNDLLFIQPLMFEVKRFLIILKCVYNKS